MTDLNLAPEERDIVEAWARDRHSVASRVGLYSSFIVPLLLFAGYGILTGQLPAVVIALLGVLIFLAWRLSRELAQAEAYRSLFRKIAEHERGKGERT